MAADFSDYTGEDLYRQAVDEVRVRPGRRPHPRRRLRRLLAGPLSTVEDRYIAFFTRGGEPYERMEARLHRVPFGAQYYVAARHAGNTRIDALRGDPGD